MEKYTELRAQITRAREEGQEKHRRSLCVRSGRRRAKIGVEKSVMIFIFVDALLLAILYATMS